VDERYRLKPRRSKKSRFVLILLLFLLHQRADDEAPPDLSVSGRFTNPGQVEVLFFRVFSDIVHPSYASLASLCFSLVS